MKTQNNKLKAHDSPFFIKFVTFLTTLSFYNNMIYTIHMHSWYQVAILGYTFTKVKVISLVINQYVSLLSWHLILKHTI